MQKLKGLNDLELLTILRGLEELSASATNITIGWVQIPEMPFDDIVSERLDLRSGRTTKPIFVINLKKDIKDILADRYIAKLSVQQQENVRIAV